MQRHHFFIGIIGFAIVCGLFHPLLAPVIVLVSLLEGPLFFNVFQLVFLFASLLVSTACIIVAGIPAALYERNLGRRETDAISLWIWLIASALIALPAFGNMFAIGF